MRALLFASLAFAACVSSQQPGAQGPGGPPGTTPSSDDGSGSNVVCHEETPVGSTIPRQVCREKDSTDARDEPGIMNTMQHPTPHGGGPQGPGH
jgi:hypothetical protein